MVSILSTANANFWRSTLSPRRIYPMKQRAPPSMSPPRKRGRKEEVARPIPGVIRSGDIRLTAKDIINHPGYLPDVMITVGGVAWLVSLSFKRDNLAISLQSYMHNRSPLWSIAVKARVELINYNISKNNVTHHRHTFNSKSEVLCGMLLPWRETLSQGFVVRGNVTAVVRFSIITKTGFRSIPAVLDFTDRNDSRHDVTLKIDGVNIYANKAILGAYSAVFNVMFYGGFCETGKKEIELKDVGCQDFIEMLNVIYPSSQKITDENAEYLLFIADRFEIKTIVDEVEEFLVSQNSYKIDYHSKLRLANIFRLDKLQKRCIEWFDANKHCMDQKDIDSFIVEEFTNNEMNPQFDFTDASEPRHDVALVIEGGEKIYVSKQFLSIHSAVFKEKFDGIFKDESEMKLHYVNRKEFLEMLSVIYPSHQKITDDNVRFLLKLGARFKIDCLLVLIEHHLISSSRLKLPVKLFLSDRYGLLELQGHCLDKLYPKYRAVTPILDDGALYRRQLREELKASAEYQELSAELKKAIGK